MPVFAQSEVEVTSEDEELRDELNVIAEEIASLRESLRELRQTQNTIDGEIAAIAAVNKLILVTQTSFFISLVLSIGSLRLPKK